MDKNDEWQGFWIGQQPTQTLRVVYLKPVGLTDEGWHKCLAEAVVPGFTARFNFECHLGDFRHFMNEVRSMHDSLKGTARFSNVESNVEIDGRIDRLGHVTWDVTLRHDGMGPELKFSMQEDQTMLWNVAAKIDDMFESLKTGTKGRE